MEVEAVLLDVGGSVFDWRTAILNALSQNEPQAFETSTTTILERNGDSNLLSRLKQLQTKHALGVPSIQYSRVP